MQFHDSPSVVSQRIEHGDFRISASPENPVRVETEFHVVRIGRCEHMVKFTRSVSQFDIVVVIGEGNPHLAKFRPEAIE